jgi:hypothetical protein
LSVADTERERSLALIETGSELAGAVVGAAIGLIGGPPGVVVGAGGGVVVTRTLKHVGSEIASRVLGPRQAIRVGAAFAFAGAEILGRLESGDEPRSDGWFAPDDSTRAAADEVLEGVLLNAADAYEERKVPLLGRLYASLAFDSTVDRGYANLLVGLLRRLSYRQLVLVALLGSARLHAAAAEAAAKPGEGWQEKVFANAPEPLLVEMTELGVIGVLGFRQPGGWVASPLGTMGGADVRSWSFNGLVLSTVGEDLSRLAGLEETDVGDQESLLRLLLERS